jgi:hypothetical protein
MKKTAFKIKFRVQMDMDFARDAKHNTDFGQGTVSATLVAMVAADDGGYHDHKVHTVELPFGPHVTEERGERQVQVYQERAEMHAQEKLVERFTNALSKLMSAEP